MTRTALFALLVAFLAACAEDQPIGKARINEGQAVEVGAKVYLQRPFSVEDLEGKVWVGSLIFTTCTTSCIPMCGEMADLQEEFEQEKDFLIVTATVDPEHDTAEVLSKFGRSYGADPERWLFLRGTKEEIRTFAVEVLRLPWNADEPIVHSVDFVLVDRAGKIRDYFRQTKPDEMRRMRAVIRELLAEKAP
jgi:protein SCO1